MPHLVNDRPCLTVAEYCDLFVVQPSALRYEKSVANVGMVWSVAVGAEVVVVGSISSPRKRAVIAAKYGDILAQARAVQQDAATQLLVGLQMGYIVADDYQAYLQLGQAAQQATDLQNSIAWLRMLAATPKPTPAMAAIDINTPMKLMAAVVAALQVLRPYKLTITTTATLRLKVAEYKAQGIAALLHGGVGNKNKCRIGKVAAAEPNTLTLQVGRVAVPVSDPHLSVLWTIYTNPDRPSKFTKQETYNRYVRYCQKKGMMAVGRSTAMNYLLVMDRQGVTAWERDGFDSLDKMLPHVRGRRATMALSKGGMDGFMVDFYTDITTKKGEKARVMLVVALIMDYATEAITGLSVGLVENGVLMRESLRNHINMVGKPYIEMDTDLQVPKDTKAMLNKFCKMTTQYKTNDPMGNAPNKKSRFIERYGQEFLRIMQSVDSGWKAGNITSRKRANTDYTGKHSAVASYAEGVRIVNECVLAFNHIKLDKYAGQSRYEVFKATQNPEIKAWEAWEVAMLFATNTTIATVRNSRVVIQVANQKYEYWLHDAHKYANKMHRNTGVRVLYDEADLSEVVIMGYQDAQDDTKDIYIMRAKLMTETDYYQRAKAEQTPKDAKSLRYMTDQRQAQIHDVGHKHLQALSTAAGIDMPEYTNYKDARKIVLGALEQQRNEIVEPFGQRYAEALNTDEAKRQRAINIPTEVDTEVVCVPEPMQSMAKMPRKQPLYGTPEWYKAQYEKNKNN
jgi:roadblock/LC7 domain-containing protein